MIHVMRKNGDVKSLRQKRETVLTGSDYSFIGIEPEGFGRFLWFVNKRFTEVA